MLVLVVEMVAEGVENEIIYNRTQELSNWRSSFFEVRIIIIFYHKRQILCLMMVCVKITKILIFTSFQLDDNIFDSKDMI